MIRFRANPLFLFLICFFLGNSVIWSAQDTPDQASGGSAANSWLSSGRAEDSTEKRISEIHDSERRRIPLDVSLKASNTYSRKGPVEVTVIVTNLFDNPVLLNRRMLVNHARLPGEVVFGILGPDGKPCEIQRLVTPMSVHDDDFVVLPKGQSVQRTIDLSDLYPLKKKGVYKVKVMYHNELDQPMGSLRAWKGAVVSDPVDIQLD